MLKSALQLQFYHVNKPKHLANITERSLPGLLVSLRKHFTCKFLNVRIL